jgi:hypothetical protein
MGAGPTRDGDTVGAMVERAAVRAVASAPGLVSAQRIRRSARADATVSSERLVADGERQLAVPRPHPP